MVRLRHIHLPAVRPAGGTAVAGEAAASSFPTYSLAVAVQEVLRRRLLAAKDAPAAAGGVGDAAAAKIPPTVLSFTPSPTYTLGRRQTSPLSAAELARLRAPLRLPVNATAASRTGGQGDGATAVVEHTIFTPQILASPRGGLTTYHGPGQVVLWPVLDLKAPLYNHFTVRSYSRLLETTTMSTLARHFGLAAFTTEDPGVWVRHLALLAGASEGEGEARKIAAMGVHLRRHVSALGVAVNLAMAAPEAGDEATNPWRRIVACGLEGKEVTSVGVETSPTGVAADPADMVLDPRLDPEAVARAWAEELAAGIGADGVETMSGEEADRLLAEAEASRGGEDSEDV